MVLILHVPGATLEALARGLAVAQQVLAEAGVTVAEAALGYLARAELESRDASSAIVHGDVTQAAAAFSLAQAAAIDTCCEGRAAPAGSRLQALDA